VLESAARLMPRVVAPLVSAFYATLHAGRGVTVVCDAGVTEIAAMTLRARTVTLSNGASYPADLLSSASASSPHQSRTDAGLATGMDRRRRLPADERPCDLRDRRLRRAPKSVLRGRARLESVRTAADQGRTVAATIAPANGRAITGTVVLDDQFDVDCRWQGCRTLRRRVTRGNPTRRNFRCTTQGVAADCRRFDQPSADHIVARRLLASHVARDSGPGLR